MATWYHVPAYADTSETRKSILDFIKVYMDQHDIAPTHVEIGRGCYLAESTVRYHLKRLAAQGWIRHEAKKIRGITLLES